MSKTNDGTENTEKFYNPKEKIIDPEDYSYKTYLYDLGQTMHEIKEMLAMYIDSQLNLSDYINDPILKKEKDFKVISSGK